MKAIATFALLIILICFVGCGVTSVIKVGMSMNQASEILKLNKSKEFQLDGAKWGTSAWRVFTMPDNTCVELYCEDGQTLIVTNITVGDKSKGYWIDSSSAKKQQVQKLDISDFEKEN